MEIKTDFLVIGSGIAGLSFALKVADHGDVALITKKEDTDSNTNYAQGGIASVLSPDDSMDFHVEDTLRTGAGLCHPDVVEKVVAHGPLAIMELTRWGANFSLNAKNERLDLGREGGHSHNRVVHAADFTGQEIERVLIARVKEHPNVQVYQDHMAIDLITQHHMKRYKRKTGEKVKCWGAYVLDANSGQVKTFLARFILVATGGSGQVYQHTTNPSIATGDRLAMAYRAGATVANLEFVQFHPTTLWNSGERAFLISEAVRGEGAKLRLKSGYTFMEQYHPLQELAPRDVVARAIDHEMKKSGDEHVYLDVTLLDPEYIRQRFPTIHQKCLSLGLDMTKEWLPVVPAAHYMCGGVATDIWAQTAIEGLYACGEVAFTGMHGANRLASNSLLEAVAFADFAAQRAKEELPSKRHVQFPSIPRWSTEGIFDHKEWVVISHDRAELQMLMWDYVGIVRSNSRLERAKARTDILLREIDDFYRKNPVRADLLELRNMAMVAELIIRSALMRKESRGLHFNVDYPDQDDRQWAQDTKIISDH